MSGPKLDLMTTYAEQQAEMLINDFAIRSFRDVADGDYIAARMAYRARLAIQFLWASQQAVEKYLKCILLLNRIPANKASHDLEKAFARIKDSGIISLQLSTVSEEFLMYLNRYGRFRYLEVSTSVEGSNLRQLDWLVWDLRRYCTRDTTKHVAPNEAGEKPRLVRLANGYLERVIDSGDRHARASLIWRNGFFGRRTRQRVTVGRWFTSTNAPLYLSPEILDEILRYVYLPQDVVEHYRQHLSQKGRKA